MATPPPPPSRPAPASVKPSLPKAPPPPANRAAANRPVKTFAVHEWSGDGEGEKIILYAQSGMGKTTLASMAPNPVFIGVDDGARKIRDPRNGAVLNAVAGVEDFYDVRAALAQPSLFDSFDTIVIDTITKVEELSEAYLFDNYKTEKGASVKSIEGYGWGKGYRHSLEVMRLILQDLDPLVRKGKNVVLLAQESAAVMPNAEGLDYLQAGPKLHHNKQVSTRLDFQEWADHVFRIGYLENQVVGAGDATKGKLATSDTTRVVYTQAARHFFAKSRTLHHPAVSFATPDDDSLWQYLFGEAK